MLRPVKRSRSTRYDGARQSSCMPWVWCGSSHNTLVIHWRIDAGREVLSDGCVRTATSSEVPATRVLRQCGVGWVGDTESAYMAEDRGWKPSPPFIFLFCFVLLLIQKKRINREYMNSLPIWAPSSLSLTLSVSLLFI